MHSSGCFGVGSPMLPDIQQFTLWVEMSKDNIFSTMSRYHLIDYASIIGNNACHV
jgi:hypothetical protein